jgi:hypothetical protein
MALRLTVVNRAAMIQSQQGGRAGTILPSDHSLTAAGLQESHAAQIGDEDGSPGLAISASA